MAVVVEHRLTHFADHPDPTRGRWIGFIEVLLRYDDGRQAIDVLTLDEGYETEAAALDAISAWVAQYRQTLEDTSRLVVVRL